MIANDTPKLPGQFWEKEFFGHLQLFWWPLFIFFLCRKKIVFWCKKKIEDRLLVQEENLLVQEEDKEWSPEKLKMVRKRFFPELSGDLWGVICYHHWYLRAGLEGPEKSFFSSCKMRFKMMQNYPLSIFHALVRPESLPGADLSIFQKIRFSLFWAYLGPFRAH